MKTKCCPEIIRSFMTSAKEYPTSSKVMERLFDRRIQLIAVIVWE
jgi:hypothetical protein